MRYLRLLFPVILLFCGRGLSQDISAGQMLNSFVEDFKTDPAAADNPDLVFGIKVAGHGSRHVTINKHGRVSLHSGLPSAPTFFYTLSKESMRKLYEGEWSIITAMARANLSDPAPVNFGFMEGFSADSHFFGWFTRFSFHFWTRGFPEIVPFGKKEHTRVVHGADVAALYYQEGLRSAWYRIASGQHINESPEDQKNPFPTLAIFISGQAQAKIGGEERTLQSGECVFIPAGISHEFWNNKEEAAEFIIIMFGEGA